MKAVKIGFLVLMVLSLVSIPCYGQTTKVYYYTGQDSMPEDDVNCKVKLYQDCRVKVYQ